MKGMLTKMETDAFNRPYSTSKVKSPCPPTCPNRSAFCKRDCPSWAAYESQKKAEDEQKRVRRSGEVVSLNQQRIYRKQLLRYKYSHR